MDTGQIQRYRSKERYPVLVFVILFPQPFVCLLQDVLVISQFVRADGEVLPQEVTQLCNKAHRRLVKLVEQAHRAGKGSHLRNGGDFVV